MTRRAGTTVAEMVVALLLAGVIAGAAGRGLAQLLRDHRDRAAATAAADAVQLARDVLRAELAHADANIRLLGDTAVQLASLRLVATACDASGDRLVLPDAAPAWSTPRPGDSLAVADTTIPEWRTTVRSVSRERPSMACPAGGTRLVLASMPPASVLPLLLPVRVWRAVRYVLYRAGDGSWWMGERSCTPGCSSAQPITGPLLGPSLGGLRMALVSRAGGPPVALDLTVRATYAGGAAHLSARLPLATLR
ncbi:MAG: PulJ/GspJ family protein [Gemmatimonadaceae bacterium]